MSNGNGKTKVGQWLQRFGEKAKSALSTIHDVMKEERVGKVPGWEYKEIMDRKKLLKEKKKKTTT